MHMSTSGKWGVALVLAAVTAGPPSWAGHLSSLELLSVTANGSQWQVGMRLSIGAGKTGTQKGADGETRTFAIAAWGSSSIDILAFTPEMVAGTPTGAVNTGVDVGSDFNIVALTYDPVFSPLAASTATLAYLEDDLAPLPLACVFDTATCGDVHQEVFDIYITYSELPIGLRAFGIEGNGDPRAGVTPNRDMAIDLRSFVPVDEPPPLSIMLLAIGVLWGAMRVARRFPEGLPAGWRRAVDRRRMNIGVALLHAMALWQSPRA